MNYEDIINSMDLFPQFENDSTNNLIAFHKDYHK